MPNPSTPKTVRPICLTSASISRPRYLQLRALALLVAVVIAAVGLSATSSASRAHFLSRETADPVKADRSQLVLQAAAAMRLGAQPYLQGASDVSVPQTGPVVSTDKLDYAPGETANINGTGFQANETVALKVVHADETAEGGNGHEPWTVATDARGNLVSTWHVNSDDSQGSSFLLTAHSASGGHAEWRFTDAGNPTTSGPMKVAVFNANVVSILNSNPAFQATNVTQAQIESGGLAQYDVLVTRMCCGQPTPAMVTAIKNFVAAGGGYVGEWWGAGAAFSSVGPHIGFNNGAPTNFLGLFTGCPTMIAG